MVTDLGKNRTRSNIIRILLDFAAKEMSLYSEHKWWVAKQVLKDDTDMLTMHMDIESFPSNDPGFY